MFNHGSTHGISSFFSSHFLSLFITFKSHQKHLPFIEFSSSLLFRELESHMINILKEQFFFLRGKVIFAFLFLDRWGHLQDREVRGRARKHNFEFLWGFFFEFQASLTVSKWRYIPNRRSRIAWQSVWNLLLEAKSVYRSGSIFKVFGRPGGNVKSRERCQGSTLNQGERWKREKERSLWNKKEGIEF